MKLSHQKLKMMYLAKILMEQTDEEHTITVPEMIAELSKLGISAERKSIYDDLEYLQLFGLDICSNKPRPTNYYKASRDFELPELKLLVDSVQSSKFITQDKTCKLIKKIENLASAYDGQLLQRQVFVTNRVKSMNESIYYNVDRIHDAIAENSQIRFRYFDWGIDLKKHFRDRVYEASPYALLWDDENYYLIAYKEKYGNYTHYRVDKMESIELTENDRILGDKDFNISDYSKKMFQMYGGEETDVAVEFTNDLVGVVYDKFGMNIPVVKSDDEHFICHIKVAVSPQFLSWIVSFGDRARIISPDKVVKELYDLVDKIKNIYK